VRLTGGRETPMRMCVCSQLVEIALDRSNDEQLTSAAAAAAAAANTAVLNN